MKSLFAICLGLWAGVLVAAPKWHSIEKLVTTAGTRVALSATELKSPDVCLKARSNNAGLIYVGGADVASTNGWHLAANAELCLGTLFGGTGGSPSLDLRDIYLDAATNGDGARVIYNSGR